MFLYLFFFCARFCFAGGGRWWGALAFQLFRMLHSPEYMQPQSRSADGDVTNAVGAGLDELMRHVPALRPQCIKALVVALKEVRL